MGKNVLDSGSIYVNVSFKSFFLNYNSTTYSIISLICGITLMTNAIVQPENMIEISTFFGFLFFISNLHMVNVYVQWRKAMRALHKNDLWKKEEKEYVIPGKEVEIYQTRKYFYKILKFYRIDKIYFKFKNR